MLTKGRIAWRGILAPLNTWFLGPTRLDAPNAISISSSVLAQLAVMTNRQTDTHADHATSVTIAASVPSVHALRPNNNKLLRY